MYENPALPEFVEQVRGYDAEFFVVIFSGRRIQYGQTAFHRKTGRDDQNIFRKMRILGISDLVQDIPGNDHRHDNGLTRAGRHFRAQPPERSAIGRNLHADPIGSGRFGEPYQRFDCFQLAEEKPPGFKFLRVLPVFQQPFCDSRDARVPGLSPSLYARANLLDEGDSPELAGIVETLGTFRCDDVAGRATAFGEIE